MIKKLMFGLLTACCLLNAKDLSHLDDRFVHWCNYADICDFVYRSNTPFDVDAVFPGSVVFLAANSVPDFFTHVHPRIRNPYIMVYMSGGLWGPIIDDPKILHFFCAGGDGSLKNNHPKYSYLPIGLFVDYDVYQNQKIFSRRFLQLRAKEKQKMVYMNMTVSPWRENTFNLLKDRPYVSVGGKKGFFQYMSEMAGYKFVVSPPGDVLDCFRHWEAIMVGCIPIMQHTPIDSLFEGLPVLFIDDWNQITEEFLNQKYIEIKSKQYNYKKLYLRYWVDKINEIKAENGL